MATLWVELLAKLEAFNAWAAGDAEEVVWVEESRVAEYEACRRELVMQLHDHFTGQNSSSKYHEGDIDIFVDQSETSLWKAVDVLRQGPLRYSHRDVDGNDLANRILSFLEVE